MRERLFSRLNSSLDMMTARLMSEMASLLLPIVFNRSKIKTSACCCMVKRLVGELLLFKIWFRSREREEELVVVVDERKGERPKVFTRSSCSNF